eukprot:TRINITY_DN2283_c0_g1_i3.p1 TRINITY_DN2283_c0_g1~~TRINITY_DN2283_c0_g1_i3.p1  ORF type:complete len:197 (+),score=9.02 TRINITY_DN2283_c0_g1_i3:171-761(+)
MEEIQKGVEQIRIGHNGDQTMSAEAQVEDQPPSLSDYTEEDMNDPAVLEQVARLEQLISNLKRELEDGKEEVIRLRSDVATLKQTNEESVSDINSFIAETMSRIGQAMIDATNGIGGEEIAKDEGMSEENNGETTKAQGINHGLIIFQVQESYQSFVQQAKERQHLFGFLFASTPRVIVVYYYANTTPKYEQQGLG